MFIENDGGGEDQSNIYQDNVLIEILIKDKNINREQRWLYSLIKEAMI